MSLTRSLLLGTALAAISFVAAEAATTVYATPAAGDTSATIPAGSTVVVPDSTGTPRAPEVVNNTGHTAAGNETPEANDTSNARAPQVHDAGNGITYVSGGVGMQGKKIIESMQHDYRLKLTFAVVSGHYLANVNVTIADKSGATVLQVVTEGPFLLVNLPAGTYTVTSTYENASETKKISVGSSGMKSYSITFKESVS